MLKIGPMESLLLDEDNAAAGMDPGIGGQEEAGTMSIQMY